MWGWIGAGGVLLVWLFCFSLMKIAAPANAEERRIEDEEQMAALDRWQAKQVRKIWTN